MKLRAVSIHNVTRLLNAPRPTSKDVDPGMLDLCDTCIVLDAPLEDEPELLRATTIKALDPADNGSVQLLDASAS